MAKTAVEFAKGNEKFVILGGALGRQTLDAAGVKALSEPAVAGDAAGGQILGLIQAPASRLVSVLQAPGGQLARVLAAYAKRDEAARGGQDGPGALPGGRVAGIANTTPSH